MVGPRWPNVAAPRFKCYTDSLHRQNDHQTLEEARNQHALAEFLSILDVGCGGGILSESLEALGGRVTGIDASDMSITVARDHARRSQSKNTYLNTPIESVPDSSFDIVVCMEVVEHVESLEIFMEETCRKVKKDGLLFLATIKPDPLQPPRTKNWS